MRRLKFLLLFTLALGLLLYSAWRFPLPLHGAPALLQALGADALLLLVAAAWGRRFLSRLKLFHRSLTEELLFSAFLGLIALSLLGSFLGAIGILYDWVLWLVVGILLLTQWDHVEHFGAELRRNLRAKQPWDGSSMEVLALLAGGFGLLAALGLCLAPVTFYDALNYHFAGVQRAVQLGRDLPQAANFYTWLPDLPQPLWSMASLLSGAAAQSSLAPALLNLGMAVLLGLALGDASSRWISERKLWLAPALAWTQPLLILSFGVFSPDGWMAAFAFLALFAFLAATEERDLRAQGAWLGLMAFFSGAACSAKLVALEPVGALGLLLAYEAWRRPSWRRPVWLLWGALLFALPLWPWALRGACLRGNPFYPFAWGFGSHQYSGGPASYFQQLAGYGSAWWRLPWQIFFEPGELGGGGHMSWLLLAMAPAALVWRTVPSLRRAALYVGLSLAFWSLGPHVLRYALYALPAGCLLAAYGCMEAEDWAASLGWVQVWRLMVLIGLFLGAGQTLLIATKDFQPWNVALGLQDPQAYLMERHVPQAEAAAWVRTRPGARHILVLGDGRSAYLPPSALVASSFDEHPFKAWAARASSPQDLGAIVRRKGYDFVLFSRAEWARVEDPQRPLYWSRDDAPAAARVRAWLDALIQEPGRPRLELSQGAGWVIDLR